MDIKQRLSNGQSLHSIASDTGHSRNTVRRIQRSEHPLQKPKPAKPRPTRAQKLDPYRDYIRSRVEQFDLDATRLLPEIQAMGYTGGVVVLSVNPNLYEVSGTEPLRFLIPCLS